MTIREARLPADEPAILSFINGLQDYEAAFEPDRRRDPNFSIEHWRELQHDQTAERVLVEPERRHGFLADIFVMPEARGKGLGRALIAGCEDWARERCHKLLTIGVLTRNAHAIRAYEGAGYAPYTLMLRRYLG